MKIAVCNLSSDTRLAAADVARMVLAIERQVNEQYAPFWQEGACAVRLADKPGDIVTDEFPVLITATADEADALGYHTIAFGRVFTSPIYDNGGTTLSGDNSVSVTLSHEVLEAICDPYASWWQERDDGDFEPLEVCDRVEGDSYAIDGVSVSNFLGPRAFRSPDGNRGPFDWMTLLTAPTEIRPGGYVQVWTPGSAEVRSIFGSRFPAWKHAVKEHRAARSSRRKSFIARTTVTKPESPGAIRVGR